MGYGSYKICGGPLQGEMGGYGINATCGKEGCDAAIDRGTGYMCGDNPHGGDDDSCGLWFCSEHLVAWPVFGQRCELCAAQIGVYEQLAEVYRPERADIWMSAANPQLGGAAPDELIDTLEGCHQVADLLAVLKPGDLPS